MRPASTRLGAALAVIVAVLLTVDFVRVQWARTDADRDLAVYHWAADELRVDRSPYAVHEGPHVPTFAYLYPPPFAAALSLLPRSDFVTFARWWLALLVIAYWTAAALLARIAMGRWSVGGSAAIGILTGALPGVLMALNMGQVDVLFWTALAAGFVWPAALGAALFGIALVKPFAVFPLVALLIRHDRGRVLPGAVAVAGVAALVTVAVMGPIDAVAQSWVWVRDVLPSLGQGQVVDSGTGSVVRFGLPAVPDNLSLSMIPVRALGMPAWGPAWLLAASIAAPVAAIWFGRRLEARAYAGVVLAATLLFAPLARPSYLVLLLPLVALWWRGRQGRHGEA